MTWIAARCDGVWWKREESVSVSGGGGAPLSLKVRPGRPTLSAELGAPQLRAPSDKSSLRQRDESSPAIASG